MKIIKIKPEKSGAHFYQTSNSLSVVPKGWAIIPDDMETPNIPYGDITVEEINGVMTVTSWKAGEIPETPETKPEPTAQDDTDTMLVYHEYRITLLELGV